jgi:putative FmdB family regulatory protein
MPLYEYQCKDCHQTIEVIQKFSDPDLTECGECGGTLERLLSAPAIRFKGAGWYVNDYGKSNGNGTQRNAAESETNGSSKADKTESKAPSKDSSPAKKAESGEKKSSKVA